VCFLTPTRRHLAACRLALAELGLANPVVASAATASAG